MNDPGPALGRIQNTWVDKGDKHGVRSLLKFRSALGPRNRSNGPGRTETHEYALAFYFPMLAFISEPANF
jgi:hypothetical protein